MKKNAFNTIVQALRDKGLSSDEILEVMGEVFGRGTKISVNEEVKPIQVFTDKEKENKVKDILLQLGINCGVRGYSYLIKAILLYNKDKTIGFTKIIYPEVAEMFGTTGEGVGRAISHAIEVAWKRNDPEVVKKFFGRTIKGKPSNSEFIAMCSEWLDR